MRRRPPAYPSHCQIQPAGWWVFEPFTGSAGHAVAAAPAAGCALLRIARARGDESLLALAELWSTRAVRALESPDAFWNEEP